MIINMQLFSKKIDKSSSLQVNWSKILISEVILGSPIMTSRGGGKTFEKELVNLDSAHEKAPVTNYY